jgi:hypothetical protein
MRRDARGIKASAAALIGFVNATGGGLLRDVLSRENPILFQPGQFYGVVAFVGVAVFLGLGVGFKTPAWVAAVVCVAVTFILRVLTIIFDIRTHAVREHAIQSRVRHGFRGTVHRLRTRRSDRDFGTRASRGSGKEPGGHDPDGRTRYLIVYLYLPHGSGCRFAIEDVGTCQGGRQTPTEGEISGTYSALLASSGSAMSNFIP